MMNSTIYFMALLLLANLSAFMLFFSIVQFAHKKVTRLDSFIAAFISSVFMSMCIQLFLEAMLVHINIIYPEDGSATSFAGLILLAKDSLGLLLISTPLYLLWRVGRIFAITYAKSNLYEAAMNSGLEIFFAMCKIQRLIKRFWVKVRSLGTVGDENDY